jgi:outer membrane protein assembly factor BamA
MLRALGLTSVVLAASVLSAQASEWAPDGAAKAERTVSTPKADAAWQEVHAAQTSDAASSNAPATPTTAASTPSPQPALPTLAELEAAGAVIGEIRINTQNIFDPDDPRERGLLYRWANALHIKTRPNIIEHALLFQKGDKLSVKRIEETERLLRTNAFIYDVSIKAMAYQNGLVDIEVKTFDTWSLTASANVSRAGGANTTGLKFQERNFLGTGLSVGLTSSSNADRKGTEFEVTHRHLLGNWTEIGYKKGSYDDGSSQAFSFARPFYALDARWAAGISSSTEDSRISSYSAGVLADQYQRKQQKTDVFGGWSQGLVDGWTNRYFVGVKLQDDRFSPSPAFTSPALPADQRLVTPYVRLDVLQDDFEKLSNLDQVGRAEYIPNGFALQTQLGRSFTALGSTRNLWDYQAAVSDGFMLFGNQLLASASIKGQFGEGRNEHQVLSMAAKYYVTHNPRRRTFIGLSGSVTSSADSVDQLQLGGDNGLRGYPQRYQNGQRRSLITVEERFYSDAFIWRLFRVGGAVFYDGGRAWGGPNQSKTNAGWVSDVGLGLRFFSVRSAKSTVLHLDFAFPLQRDPAIKPFQVLFQTKTSF